MIHRRCCVVATRKATSPALTNVYFGQSFLATQRRHATTGEYHEYKPGPIAKFCRTIVLALPTAAQKAMGRRIRGGITEVKRMEDEVSWIKLNGSPLVVMGLPEEVDVADVKARYKQLTLQLHPDHGGDPDEFRKMQTAYGMLMNRDSVYYLDGYSPDLAAELGSSTARRSMQFGAASVLIGAVCCYLFGEYIAAAAWEGILYLFDPKFYNFMIQREKLEEDARRRGEEVDTNPTRLAPKKLQKLMLPGKFRDQVGHEADEAEGKVAQQH
eukprot:PhM_4_TR1230/c0_g1_i1/m.76867